MDADADVDVDADPRMITITLHELSFRLTVNGGDFTIE